MRDDSSVLPSTSQVPGLHVGVTSQPPPKKKSEVNDLFDEGAAEEDLFSLGGSSTSTTKVCGTPCM